MDGNKLKNPHTDLLMQAVLTLETEDDAYRFFEDICTIAEIKSMALRLSAENSHVSCEIEMLKTASQAFNKGYFIF